MNQRPTGLAATQDRVAGCRPAYSCSCRRGAGAPGAHGQTGADPHEWRFYGGDPGHTKYTPLDRITADNVDQLRIAWTWTSVDEKLRAENPVIRDGQRFRTYAYEVTPLVVDGVLYTTTNLGQVAAIVADDRRDDLELRPRASTWTAAPPCTAS